MVKTIQYTIKRSLQKFSEFDQLYAIFSWRNDAIYRFRFIFIGYNAQYPCNVRRVAISSR